MGSALIDDDTERRQHRPLDGKTAVVIGSAAGVGAATVRRLSSLGATVACLDINMAGAQEIASSLKDENRDAAAFHCDLTEPDTVAAAVTAAGEWSGRIDVLANVAALAHVGTIEETTPEDCSRILTANVVGPFAASRAALPFLKKTRGCIVSVSSLSGIKGMPYGSTYSASKGGLGMLTQAMAVELMDDGVRAVAIAPGGIATDMKPSGGYPDAGFDTVLTRFRTPWGISQPTELADIIAFLTSDAARLINGVVIPVDGAASA